MEAPAANTIDRQIEDSVSNLLATIANRLSPEDLARIRDAYELAREAHSHQRRKSGEPYIIHPIAVARIVAIEFELGANPIIAAFLHDVVEDTPTTVDDIRQRFGPDVAFLVDVVTKKKKSNYQHSKQVDNYQQILSSVQFDIRALLIKLADRLHNMRTLDSMRPDKQMKIAGETDYFYAPLANRLGLYHVKTELENLSFRYRCSRDYYFIEGLIERERTADSQLLADFMAKIDALLTAKGVKAFIEVRYRTPYSIWRRMTIKGVDFNHADNKRYTRIVFPLNSQSTEKETSLFIYSILSDHFKERPGSLLNYINAPKENGYQSFHIKLLSDQGTWEEVHISSERMARNSRLGCMAERTEENVQSWIEKFRSILSDLSFHREDMDYMDGVTSSFYNDDIRVFTPTGQVVILPKGATALDFAFEIHSEVGQHAQYARVNGKLQSVKSPLHRGDCVEIGTRPDCLPQPDWTEHVLTYKAKRFLRSYFAHIPRPGYQRCPKCNPLPGDDVMGFQDGGEVVIHRRDCATIIRQASQQGDNIVPVDFRESNDILYPVRIRIRSLDRHHLLVDLVSCITEQQNLSISKLVTETIDCIVETTIDFQVHSVNELWTAINTLGLIPGVDEVDSLSLINQTKN